MTTKVLVTGANGQLAKSISELNTSDEKIEWTFLDKEKLDISDFKSVQQFLLEEKFDYCINCAAYTNVEQAEEENGKANLVNALAVGNLAKSCAVTNTVLIHISTDYVFDGQKKAPYSETDTTNPLSIYGKTKLHGEYQIIENCTEYFILRTSWLYSKFGKNFLKTIVKKIKNNEKLKIVDSQVGVPTSTMLVARFVTYLINNRINQHGVYNVSPDGQTSWYGFAREIASYFTNYPDKNIKPTTHVPTKAQRPNYSVLDNNKIKSLGFITNSWENDLKAVLKDLDI